MRSTLSRISGRLVTGPVAFALAGVVDVLVVVAVALRARAPLGRAGRPRGAPGAK